ncbi:unnamed protein product [Penicillium salamii]|uniref:Uncharacterized protein n=1 Tax=Penicillium salamii TaxID=1612424 RepID=A0A9W4IAU5_9EURO|nr:unnamed protein product [Penicillium salamii]
MELPLKREVEGYYVFCKTDVINKRAVLQWNQPMTEGAMSGRLRNLREIHDFLQSMFTHRFRYGERKMLNESSAISEAQQNLIMKHADTRTFLNHYLPRHIDTDIQNIMNGRESNKSLMRAITRMSKWIDKRRPRHLTSEQRASLREHPEYIEVTRRLSEHTEACESDPSAAMQSRLEKLRREISNTFGRLERALQKKINLLGKLFTWPTSQSQEVEWQRRNAAVAAISRYCCFLEGGPLRGRRKRRAPSDGFDEEQTNLLPKTAKNRYSSAGPLKQDILLVNAENHIKKAKKPRRCFQCYGNTEISIHRRTQKYSEYKSTLRHF